MNYFILNWSRKSKTLGLSTFFASRFLFRPGHSAIGDEEFEEADHAIQLQKWIESTTNTLELTEWDSVFVPIHQPNVHWYTAIIDFKNKKISCHNSMEERTLNNPLETPRAFAYGSWTYDVYAPTPTQTNTHDCGVHTLWHLKCLIELGGVPPPDAASGMKTVPPEYQLGGDLVGKRLSMVREILCNLNMIKL
ncbi:hypothetical protein K435DRAFT_810431 [Dendrothele bispora CBS 962.96]|uniref:Ubiquitin-like protease family profile domain-containing protein n=1 Tax=Dendrothele bispora (strain CBS 962.96) TaxID=1314807 RepID=A0A4S8KV57_DENBC|nr:hypothetical protein K435DRAFT_810431 [Dendrothele bispora CBS 962.96]